MYVKITGYYEDGNTLPYMLPTAVAQTAEELMTEQKGEGRIYSCIAGKKEPEFVAYYGTHKFLNGKIIGDGLIPKEAIRVQGWFSPNHELIKEVLQ